MSHVRHELTRVISCWLLQARLHNYRFLNFRSLNKLEIPEKFSAIFSDHESQMTIVTVALIKIFGQRSFDFYCQFESSIKPQKMCTVVKSQEVFGADDSLGLSNKFQGQY